MLTKPRTPTTYKHYISVPGGEGKREHLKEKQAVKDRLRGRESWKFGHF